MASQAEVDLIIDATGALPQLERDLDRIVNQAERNADDIDVGVGVDTQRSLRQLDAQLTSVINRVEGSVDGVEVDALINQRNAVRTLTQQINRVVGAVGSGSAVDPVTIAGVLDSTNTIRNLRTQLNRVANTIQASVPEIEIPVEVDQPRLRQASNRLRDLGETALNVAGSLGRMGLTAGSLGVAIGALIPLLAGVAAAATQVAPAAAIAVSGILAIQLAAGTLKLAMVGVEEAIEAAFDPDAKPEDLEKALKNLAPEARKFVVELRGMRSGLRAVQQEVQNRFFKDFDETLRTTARATLPVLRRGLNDAADALNAMARGAAQSARELAEDGTLGTAVNGASKSLENLSGLPGQIVKSLGQLAAASAPALDKLTRRIDSKSTEIADKLTKAFETKRMEDAINRAFATIGQLFDSVGNILSGLGNIFGGLTQEGRGLFDILEDLTQAFEDLTASEEFQLILGELAKTADTLVKNILPVLQEAFVQLAPVIEELAPVVREFIDAVGPELIPVLKELGPVLKDIALLIKDQLPIAIGIAKNALKLLAVSLEFIRFVLDEFVLPASRRIRDFLNNEWVKAFQNAGSVVFTFTTNAARRFQETRNAFGDAFLRMTNIATTFASNLQGRILSAVVSFATGFVNRIRAIPGTIATLFEGITSRMRQAGVNAILGFIGGFQSGIGRLLGIARGVADNIISTIKGALSIASPSRVMIDIGKDTGAGLEVGLESMIPRIKAAASDMATVIAPSFALPAGQSLTVPLVRTAPVTNVNVSIGNEQLNPFIDTRIDRSNRDRDRTLSGGIRR